MQPLWCMLLSHSLNMPCGTIQTTTERCLGRACPTRTSPLVDTLTASVRVALCRVGLHSTSGDRPAWEITPSGIPPSPGHSLARQGPTVEFSIHPQNHVSVSSSNRSTQTCPYWHETLPWQPRVSNLWAIQPFFFHSSGLTPIFTKHGYLTHHLTHHMQSMNTCNITKTQHPKC